MSSKLIMPQEVEVFYIIPSIRKELACAMKAAGKKQRDIAELLCVKESTVSQYISEKRGAEFKFDKNIKEAAAEAAPRIKDKLSLISETQKLLRLVKESNVLCEIHKAVSDVPKGCDVCFMEAK